MASRLRGNRRQRTRCADTESAPRAPRAARSHRTHRTLLAVLVTASVAVPVSGA
ncbi:hypothetical protein GT042_18935, partial [Streptomyces sp. SID3212]|nr:hypothetical protein [Streptomyces sp. SID3212]